MNQVQRYYLLNQYELEGEEIELIFQACLNYLTYQEATEVNKHALKGINLNTGFKERLPQLTYNLIKGIP